MRKKSLAILLTGVMASTVLAGCGGSSGTSTTGDSTQSKETGEKVEIRQAFWDAAQQPYLEACAKEFNKIYPNITITFEPNVWDEYWTKLEAAATGGSMADVFWMNGPNITKYARGGVLMPIDDTLKGSDIDLKKYPEGLVKLYNIDGTQYAIPKDFDTIGVWYNKQLFDDAGVEYPTADWTWEDMAQKAKQLTKEDKTVYGIGAPFDTQIGIYNTIFAAGGYVVSEDKKSSGYDMKETQDGIQCWIDLQEAGVSPTEANLEETRADVQFMSGRLAMYWGGSWMVGQILDSDLKDVIDVAELPSLNGNKATVIHGLGNCIFKGTKHPEEAWKWVEFLAGETANNLSAEMGAAIPALSGTSDKWVENNPQYNLKAFITAAEEYSYAYPASEKTAEWEQYQADFLKKAFNLEVSVPDACNQVAEKMNEVLANE